MDPATPEAMAARKKVLENPFNACHQVDGSSPPWAYRSASEIRSELKRRGLSDEGGKAACVKRLREHVRLAFHFPFLYLPLDTRTRLSNLEESLPFRIALFKIYITNLSQNEWILTPAGSLDIYHQKLSHLHKQSLTTLIPFAPFPKLPPEIRLIIWAFSLPGPRILAASCGNRRNGLLNFFSKNNPSNPVLLSVSREARDVALRHYRLAFGTSNIYADLSLDILYFGAGWCHQVLGPGYNVCVFDAWNKKLNRRVPAKMKDEVIEDCKKIQRVALLSTLWRTRLRRVVPHETGAILRAEALEVFPSLERLSLVAWEEESFGTPGYIEFMESAREYEGELATEFATSDFSEEEKVKGVSPPWEYGTEMC